MEEDKSPHRPPSHPSKPSQGNWGPMAIDSVAGGNSAGVNSASGKFCEREILRGGIERTHREFWRC
jgi:hypothetical protein